MSDLHELYQELIIDHGRRPRNFAVSAQANHVLEGFNPLCGDRVTVYLTEKDGVVANVTFQGAGCAISMASASLMTEAVKGQTFDQFKDLFAGFHQLMMEGVTENTQVNQGKLHALAGVAEFPARVKCATLAWHTLLNAFNKSTEV